MEQSATVQCPYCGESSAVPVETSTGSQQFITDCEVCCRPFEVVVQCEGGEILNLEARAE